MTRVHPIAQRAALALPLVSFFISVAYLLLTPHTVRSVSPDIVISQVFGGGGNTGSPFTNDFAELFNRGLTPVSISGWSLQYASSTGTSWQRVDLTGTLAPGQYFLVQFSSSGGGVGGPLPPADATGTFNIASAGGKLVLVNNNTTIASGTGCPAGASIVDLVGYGSGTNCFEGTGTAPTTSGTVAAVRRGGCTDTDNNSADFAALAPAPRNTASPPQPCTAPAPPTGVGAANPNPAAAGGEVLLTVIVTPGTNPAGTGIVVRADLTMIGGVAAQQFFDNGTNGDAATGDNVFSFQAVIPANTTPGAKTLPVTITDAQARNATAAIALTVTPQLIPVGPGRTFPTGAAVSDQKAGSILIFPVYSSNATNPNRENTRFNLTNVEPTRRAFIHLFFVAASNGDVTDSFICLTPNQTTSFLASDFDPGSAGYLVAVAVDAVLGCPVNFNFLIGDEFVKLASGHAANLGAEAIAALAGPPACDGNAVTVELKFDGIDHNALPRMLAADNLPSLGDGNSSLLVIDRIGGSLGSAGVSSIGQVFGILYNDQENAASFEFSSSRTQLRSTLSSTFPRTVPRFPTFVPAGRSGWLKFYRSDEGAIIGALLNFNANAAVNTNAFNQGHNLHKLTLTTDASFTVPVFPPHC